MNRRNTHLYLLAVAVACLAAANAGGSEPVFPGAVGFGTDARAGRGGRIIRVTNLDAQGPGSLRAAVEAKGARIVVFEVGGVIDLNRDNISIAEPFLTVAGQTAPSPGVTLIRGGISIETHNVLIRHLRVRPGDAGQARRSGWEPDGIATNAAHHVVIDHCSVTWAVDENLSASGPRHEGPDRTSHDVTFSNCIREHFDFVGAMRGLSVGLQRLCVSGLASVSICSRSATTASAPRGPRARRCPLPSIAG